MAEIKKDTPQIARTFAFRLLDKDMHIETALTDRGVSVMHRLKSPEHYTGPESFEVVVRFGDLFAEDRKMRGVRVPEDQQWSKDNPPPGGINILEFSSPVIKLAVDKISEIATEDFYDDEEKCFDYFYLNEAVMVELANASQIEPRCWPFLGLIRGGVVAGQMLDVPWEDQILVQTKRLVEGETKDSKDGDISIGITVENPYKLQEISGKTLVIADPAGATFASIVANVAYLKHMEIQPAKILIFNTVASHRGSLFALDAIRDLGFEVEIYAGGYAPKMNEDYYLVSKSGKSSVRDAGNGLNRFLPDRLKLFKK